MAAVDALLHSGLVERAELHRYVRRRRGWQGVAQARQVVELAETATESLMESVLRMVLLERGCPRFTASDVLQRPDAVAAQVRGHL